MKTLFFCFSLLVLAGGTASGQYLDVKSLRNIDSLAVWIDTPDADSTGIGVTNDRLKTQVERRLTGAGFTVVEDAPQHLYLTIDVLRSTVTDELACIVRVELLQGTWLERTGEWNYASTYFREVLGLFQPNTVATDVTSAVSDLLEQFVRDARSVNPGLGKAR